MKEVRIPDQITVTWFIYNNSGEQYTSDDYEAAPEWADLLYQPADPNESVGFIKNQSFMKYARDFEYLVELDHDDWLGTEFFDVLLPYLKDKPSFLYSDCVEHVFGSTDNHLYSHLYGWEHYKSIYGMVNKSFELSPAMLSSIYYAPNHVRIWRSDVYQELGGHNSAYKVCDDYELVLRTAIHTNFDFVHIPVPIYHYQRHENNTFVTHNHDIQVLSKRLCRQYMGAIAESWANKHGLFCLDLGGAHNSPTKGYISVDKRPNSADLCFDLTTGFPFKSGSVGVIRAVDFLEHIPRSEIVPFMNECYRVLAPYGVMLTQTPSTDGRGAFQDPTHESFWNENSFWYYTKDSHMKYVPEFRGRFAELFKETTMVGDGIAYVECHLSAVKTQRHPGVSFNGNRTQEYST